MSARPARLADLSDDVEFASARWIRDRWLHRDIDGRAPRRRDRRARHRQRGARSRPDSRRSRSSPRRHDGPATSDVPVETGSTGGASSTPRQQRRRHEPSTSSRTDFEECRHDTRHRAARLVTAFVIVALFIGGVSAMAAAGRTRHTSTPIATGDLLPDLDQEAPSELDVRRRSQREDDLCLGFRSAVGNVGARPLIVEGSRSDVAPAMGVDQLIDRVGAPGVQSGTSAPCSSPSHPTTATGTTCSSIATSCSVRTAYRRDGRSVRRGPQDRLLPRRPLPRPPCPRRHRDPCTRAGAGSINRPADDARRHLGRLRRRLLGVPRGPGPSARRAPGRSLRPRPPRQRRRRLQELSTANNAASVLLDLSWREGRP